MGQNGIGSSLSVLIKLELTDGSCAIPTHAWASPGGSLPFPGSSLAAGIAAGLCNPDLVHADDRQTWGTGGKMGETSSLWAPTTRYTHLYSTFSSHLFLYLLRHPLRTPPRIGFLTVYCLKGGSFCSCLCGFWKHLCFSVQKLFGLAERHSRSEERISGSCCVCAQPLRHFSWSAEPIQVGQELSVASLMKSPQLPVISSQSPWFAP